MRIHGPCIGRRQIAPDSVQDRIAGQVAFRVGQEVHQQLLLRLGKVNLFACAGYCILIQINLNIVESEDVIRFLVDEKCGKGGCGHQHESSASEGTCV